MTSDGSVTAAVTDAKNVFNGNMNGVTGYTLSSFTATVTKTGIVLTVQRAVLGDRPGRVSENSRFQHHPGDRKFVVNGISAALPRLLPDARRVGFDGPAVHQRRANAAGRDQSGQLFAISERLHLRLPFHVAKRLRQFQPEVQHQRLLPGIHPVPQRRKFRQYAGDRLFHRRNQRMHSIARRRRRLCGDATIRHGERQQESDQSIPDRPLSVHSKSLRLFSADEQHQRLDYQFQHDQLRGGQSCKPARYRGQFEPRLGRHAFRKCLSDDELADYECRGRQLRRKIRCLTCSW